MININKKIEDLKKGCGKDLGYSCKCGNYGIGKNRMLCEDCKEGGKK